MNDENEKPEVRLEASKTLAISEANIFKVVNDGPSFKPTLPLFPKNNGNHNHNPELTLTDNDSSEN